MRSTLQLSRMRLFRLIGRYLRSGAPLDWLMDLNRQGFVCANAIGAVMAILQISTHISDPSNYGESLGVLLPALSIIGFTAGCVCGIVAPTVHMSGRTFWFAEMLALGVAHPLAGIPLAFASDPLYRHRSLVLSSLVWKVCMIQLDAPPLHCGIFLVVSYITDACALFVNQLIWSDPGTVRMLAWSLAWASAVMVFGCINSNRLEVSCAAQQSLQAEKSAMEGLLEMLCDFQLWLSGEGSMVMKSDKRLELILGKELRGHRLIEHLADMGNEEGRLQDAFSRATESPVLLPVTFVSASAQHHNSDAFIVKQSRKGFTSEFLIGLRLTAHEQQGPTAVPATSYAASEIQGVARRKPALCPPKPHSLISSAASTTPTGKIFSNLLEGPLESDEGTSPDLSMRLESIVALGEREHWLLDSSVVQLIPERVLGMGGFGVVVCGLLHGAAVAVKVAKASEDSTSAGHLLSISNELRVFRQIRHPNIIAFHGAVVDVDTADLALVLEMSSGMPMHQFVDGTLRCVDRLRLLLDSASAIAYLHSQRPQIIHGDLKASNIMVEVADGIVRAKLLDFGLARLLTRHRRRLGGSHRWVAPEVVVRTSRAMPSADVFSFGRLIFFVLMAELPLAKMSGEQIMVQMKLGKVPRLSWTQVPLCAEGKALSDMCLEIDAVRRPCMSDVWQTMISWRTRELTQETLEQPPWLGGAVCAATSAHDDVPRQAQLSWADAMSKIRQEKLPNSVKQAGRSSGKSRQTGTAKASLRFPKLTRTSEKGQLLSVIGVIRRWNVTVPQQSCCTWHALIKVLEDLAIRQLNRNCMLNFGADIDARAYQCRQCGVIIDVDENSMGSTQATATGHLECDICGCDNLGRESRDGKIEL